MTRRELFWLLGAGALRGESDARGELSSRRLDLTLAFGENAKGLLPEFDSEEFAGSLRDARVAAITVPAKGHDGYTYYDTEFGAKHPGLKVDLFGALARACKGAGIEVGYSYPLVHDDLQARKHPEWLASGEQWLCLNTPFFQQVLRENREIVGKYAIKGVFFEDLLIRPSGCYCQWCVADRKRLGLADIGRHNKLVAQRVEKALSTLVHGGVSFGRPMRELRDEAEAFSYFKIDLGFDHRVRFLRTLRKDCVGVVHDPIRFEHECLNLVANGAKAGILASLLGRGRIDATEIKRVFSKLESLEKWTQGCRAVADIGVMDGSDERFTETLIGLHQQFNIVDGESDLALYKLIIVPDGTLLTPRLIARLDAYIDRGGPVIIAGKVDDGPFAKRALGVSFEGGERSAGSLILSPEVFGDVAATLRVEGEPVKAERRTEILATLGDRPLITRNSGAVYVGVRCLELPVAVLGELIRQLMPRPSVIAPNLPATAQVTMLEQRTQGNLRRIVHILNYPGGQPAVLENVKLSVSLPQHPLGVVLIPSEKPLEFRHNEFYTTFTVPRVDGHQAIAFE